MEKRLTFQYGRALVAGRLAIVAGAAVFLGIVVGTFQNLQWEILALLVGALATYLVVFTISPLLTDHWLTRSRLILRQGWYFRAIIAIAEIESLEVSDEADSRRVPLGIHRPLGRPTLYVTGARTGLLTLRLSQPRRFWQSLGLFASEIIFDVRDPEGMRRALNDRRRLLSPVQAHGPDT